MGQDRKPTPPNNFGNKEQQKAIMHGAGPMMVLAGPGSGKTFVLTRRIAHLINTHHVTPSEILVITFTKAAAGEMQQRFLSLCEREHHPVTFGTFHAVFYSILKETSICHAGSILSESEKKKLLRDIIQRNKYNVSMHTDMLEEILAEIGQYKNRLDISSQKANRNIDFIPQNILPQNTNRNIDFMPQNISPQLFWNIYRDFTQAQDILGKVDFDDMALKCGELFQNRPDILKRYQSKYRYLLIDEFQDIAPVQYHLIRLLATPENNLFIVGDDDQSIYGFRGARPDIMINFPKDYPNAQVVTLQINYRSTPQIVQAAGKVIAHNQNRFPKESRAEQKDGVPIHMAGYESESMMENALIQRLLMEKKARKLSECAIISRTSGCFPILAEKLRQAEIPCSFKEKVKSIYEHEMVSDLLAYMEFAATPSKERSRSQFFQFMNRPLRYISREAVDETADLRHLINYYQGRPAMRETVIRLAQDLERIRTMPVFLSINYIRKAIGYDAYLLEKFGQRDISGGRERQAGKILQSSKGEPANKSLQCGRDELGNILELADMIQASARGCKTLSAWKEVIEERRNAAEGENNQKGRQNREQNREQNGGKNGGQNREQNKEQNEGANAGSDEKNPEKGVMLMTMHGSKGLEYDKVFIVNCNEGITPYRKALSKEEIEEERRMFYVGMTRAKKELMLLYIAQREGKEKEGSSKIMPPSRFLKEMR